MLTVEADQQGQRIDNYLVKRCKGVPKTRIYRALRKGEVRVNQKRVKADYRLVSGDVLRIPPLRQSTTVSSERQLGAQRLQEIAAAILLETADYLIVCKPSGMPVHGGTGIDCGLIEGLRQLKPECRFLELVHRIDKETSGCLLIAKNRPFLLQMHDLLRRRQVKKRYWALVRGHWPKTKQRVDLPLQKNHLASGERLVVVSESGKPAVTLCRPLRYLPGATLMELSPLSGRTHQLRVHMAQSGHPIGGDRKYGDELFNKYLRRCGLRRLFLHASSLYCRLDGDSAPFLGVCAPLDKPLQALLNNLKPISMTTTN